MHSKATSSSNKTQRRQSLTLTKSKAAKTKSRRNSLSVIPSRRSRSSTPAKTPKSRNRNALSVGKTTNKVNAKRKLRTMLADAEIQNDPEMRAYAASLLVNNKTVAEICAQGTTHTKKEIKRLNKHEHSEKMASLWHQYKQRLAAILNGSSTRAMDLLQQLLRGDRTYEITKGKRHCASHTIVAVCVVRQNAEADPTASQPIQHNEQHCNLQKDSRQPTARVHKRSRAVSQCFAIHDASFVHTIRRQIFLRHLARAFCSV